MLEYIVAVSLLIASVILIRAIFKKKVSAKLIYALWFAVIIRLLVPFNFINIDLPFHGLPNIEAAISSAAVIENTPTDTVAMSVPASTVKTPAQVPYDSVPSSFPAENTESIKTETQTESDTKVENNIAESAQAERKSIDIKKIIAILWILGSGITFTVFAIPLGITYAKLLRSRRYHSNAGKTKVYVSDKVSSPCVMGIVPTIYITPYAETCDDLSLVILHEKTHISHGDHIWALLRVILIILFWWNPFIWAAALLSKRDAEVACDESVAKKLCQNERLTYSRLIVDMIPKKHGLTVAFTSSPVKERILRLTSKSKTKVVFALLAVTLVLWASLCSFLTDDNDPNKENDTAPENSLSATHTHSYESATCSLSAMCDCGAVEGEPLGHVWQTATCTSPATCQRCGIADGLPLEHSWTAATCDSAKICSVCSITEGEHLSHELIAATCTTPAYCSLCHKTYDSALGHSFTSATCTSPAICIRCSQAEGYALGHNYDGGKCTRCASKDESYKETVQEDIVITPFIFSDGSEQLEKIREWHEKYDDTDDSDDSWKYGFDTPSVDKPIRWDYGGMTP